MKLGYLAAFALVVVATPVGAQDDRSFPACTSQQEIEQVRGSDGQYVPDDCRQLTITRIQTEGSDVCVLDFEAGGDPGWLNQLRSAAVPTKWWVDCSKLTPAE